MLVSGLVLSGLMLCGGDTAKKFKFTGVKSDNVMTLSYNCPLQMVNNLNDAESQWSLVHFADSTVFQTITYEYQLFRKCNQTI